MPPPSEIQAVVIEERGRAAVRTVSLPKLRDDYILVRTTAVGINPTDWKHVDGFGDAPPGARVGCDYAGVVEQVGSKVTKSWSKGDRITGVAHGANKVQLEDGAFAEYIVVKGDLAVKTPENLTDEEAATLGIGISTVGQGLYQTLKLPLPGSSPPTTSSSILIYGGSTATGILGIQFAKISGAKVAVTCSQRNFELVKSLGADAAFDYRSPTVVEDIKAWDNNIQLVWDCIGVVPESVRIAVGVMSEKGGHYASLLPVPDDKVKEINPNAQNSLTFAYTIIGEGFQKGPKPTPAIPEHYEFGKMFWELSRGLLAEGKVKSVRPEVNRGGKGLEGVLVGLQELKADKVSGGKLVYTL